MKRVSPREAYELMQRGYAYLDVRTEPEFCTGHPAGAVNVPLCEDDTFLSQVRTRFGPDAPLVVGCASGVRSLAAAERLLAAGFTDVVEQRAGMSGVRDPFGRVRERGWRDEGLPVE